MGCSCAYDGRFHHASLDASLSLAEVAALDCNNTRQVKTDNLQVRLAGQHHSNICETSRWPAALVAVAGLLSLYS